MKTFWWRVALPVFCLIAGAPLAADFIADERLATDALAARFKTNRIDSKVLRLPKEIEKALASDPAEGLKHVTHFLTHDAGNDFLKIKRIHDWLTENIAYDNDAFFNRLKEPTEVAEIVAARKAACSGFSLLFKAMAESAGFEVIVIHGMSRKTYNSQTGQMAAHIWNAVRIGANWYLVDTTHDSRFSYTGGKFGPKGTYKDTHLFISPQAKILDNLPNDATHQFLPQPVTRDEFLKKPFVSMLYVKYGITFIDDLSAQITKERTQKSGAMQSIVERAYPQAEGLQIRLTKPANVTVYAKIKDKANKFFDASAACEQQATEAACRFSAPGKGEYTAYISARFHEPMEKAATQVYTFQIVGQ